MSTRNDIIDGLMTALDVLVDSGGVYSCDPFEIIPYQDDALNRPAESTPVLMVSDRGDDAILLEDNSHIRLAFQVDLSYFYKATDYATIQAELNAYIDSIFEWVESSPSIHSAVRQVRLIEFSGHSVDPDPTNCQGFTIATLEIVYVRDKTNSTTDGIDIYGDDFYYLAHSKLKTLVTDLITAQSTYDPQTSYVYDRHADASILLNGISIELMDDMRELMGLQAPNDILVVHGLRFSLRVHTGYLTNASQQLKDSYKTMILLNGLVNKLRANIDLDDNYRLSDVSNIISDAEFVDSKTSGGSLEVIVTVPVTHTQETE